MGMPLESVRIKQKLRAAEEKTCTETAETFVIYFRSYLNRPLENEKGEIARKDKLS
jgi:hypothetical protein